MKKLLIGALVLCVTISAVRSARPVEWQWSRYLWGGAGFVASDALRRKAVNKAMSHAAKIAVIQARQMVEPKNEDLARAIKHHAKWQRIWTGIAATGFAGQAASGYAVLQTLWDRAMFSRDRAKLNKSAFVQQADLAHARKTAYGDKFNSRLTAPIPREQYLEHVKHRHQDVYDYYARMGEQLDRSRAEQWLNPFFSNDDDARDKAALNYLKSINLYRTADEYYPSENAEA